MRAFFSALKALFAFGSSARRQSRVVPTSLAVDLDLQDNLWDAEKLGKGQRNGLGHADANAGVFANDLSNRLSAATAFSALCSRLSLRGRDGRLDGGGVIGIGELELVGSGNAAAVGSDL